MKKWKARKARELAKAGGNDTKRKATQAENKVKARANRKKLQQAALETPFGLE